MDGVLTALKRRRVNFWVEPIGVCASRRVLGPDHPPWQASVPAVPFGNASHSRLWGNWSCFFFFFFYVIKLCCYVTEGGFHLDLTTNSVTGTKQKWMRSRSRTVCAEAARFLLLWLQLFCILLDFLTCQAFTCFYKNHTHPHGVKKSLILVRGTCFLPLSAPSVFPLLGLCHITKYDIHYVTAEPPGPKLNVEAGGACCCACGEIKGQISSTRSCTGENKESVQVSSSDPGTLGVLYPRCHLSTCFVECSWRLSVRLFLSCDLKIDFTVWDYGSSGN